MAEPDQRRAVLQAILNDPKSSPETLLRACELAERLDGRPEMDAELAGVIEFYEGLRAMTPEQFDEELVALTKPVLTDPALLDDPVVRDRIHSEAGRIAREMNAELFATNAELRAALREAEALRGVPGLAERRKAASEAPSASQTAPEDDRSLKAVAIPEALRRTVATASKPVPDRVRSSFERKIRGET
jgi:hypothetical protein